MVGRAGLNRGAQPSGQSLSAAVRLSAGKKWWAVLGSNQRPIG